MQHEDEKIVIKMYLEDKLSVNQIAEKLRVSSSRVGRVLDVYKVQKRSISEAITNLFITKFSKIPFQLKQLSSFEENDLKIAGIMLYWGEGAKRSGSVNFANSDPEMIKVFLLFLRKICGIDEKRMKILIHIYPDQDYRSLENFWMTTTGIKKENFYRPHVHLGRVGTYKTKSVYGTASISYCDSKLLKLILDWIGEYKNTFLKITPP
jgi:predicted DNA-binding protein YlxM (UPF0122 family)